MDFDLFLTSPRWEILKIIANKPSSPIEIAEKLKTTVSYVSQQLKILDAANLLKKEKTGNSEKGKPRALFGLSGEFAYLTVVFDGFTNKKLINLSEHHKRLLNLWICVDPLFHYIIEKCFWKLEEDILELEGIFVDISNQVPKLLILSESRKIKTNVDNLLKTIDNKLEIILITKPYLKKYSTENLIGLYDKNKILNEMKGGLT